LVPGGATMVRAGTRRRALFTLVGP
jgi:hypothetical protein